MDWVLELRTPELTALFRAFSFLGDATFFLLFIPFGYWLWRPGLFTRIGLVLLISTLINLTLKSLFQVPRPAIPHLVAADGWAFPSGHAQVAASTWLLLGLELARRWLWPFLVVLIAAVAASRVYLGVHYPRDVVVGALVGAALGWIAWHLGRRPPATWTRLSSSHRALILAVAVPGWALLVQSAADSSLWQAAGALLGFSIGAIYQLRSVDFAVPRGRGRAVVAGVLGLAVIFALRVGLRAAFAELGLAAAMADTCRYFVITLWLTWFAPWLFVVLGLAEGRQHAGPA